MNCLHYTYFANNNRSNWNQTAMRVWLVFPRVWRARLVPCFFCLVWRSHTLSKTGLPMMPCCVLSMRRGGRSWWYRTLVDSLETARTMGTPLWKSARTKLGLRHSSSLRTKSGGCNHFSSSFGPSTLSTLVYYAHIFCTEHHKIEMVISTIIWISQLQAPKPSFATLFTRCNLTVLLNEMRRVSRV